MEKVTACLITWKRQQNLPKIIASLTECSFIDEIIIRDNSKSDNIINYARYESAMKAKNEIIYVQDDDYIIHNIEDIYNTFIKDPHRIANGGIDEYLRVVPDNIYGETQMAIVGWGSMFKNHWFQKPLLQYTNVYGKDYCFYRETDRIFSMLFNRHCNMVKVDAEPLFGDRNEDALSSQEEHVKFKNMAIKRCGGILGI